MECGDLQGSKWLLKLVVLVFTTLAWYYSGCLLAEFCHFALFSQLLKQIVARQETQSTNAAIEELSNKGEIPLDEVVEIIELPDFDRRAAKRQRENMQVVQLSPAVVGQLKDFITEISDMYKDNPFHNVCVMQCLSKALSKTHMLSWLPSLAMLHMWSWLS